ncbi:MAG: type VI secretion system transmembrane protein TssO [Candidatus Symbiothrix sp.]|nr:type VI secretion system transmembrane protein TssO [Candidatus Symbiothrix sp.]
MSRETENDKTKRKGTSLLNNKLCMDDTMNQKEKLIALAYVILLFIGITTACCLLIFFYNPNFGVINQKNSAMDKMKMIKEYQNTQSQYSIRVDSLYNKINRLNPAVKAVYEESDIKMMVADLQNVYEQHSRDIRYKSFYHIAKFYETWLNDKKNLQAQKDNLIRHTRNLEDCLIGIEQRKNQSTAPSRDLQ